MVRQTIFKVIGLLALLSLGDGAVASDYWNYSYRGFDVTTDENGGRAMAIAHNLGRFDVALTGIMQLTDSRIPTHVYELSADDARAVIGESAAASYKFTGYEAIVVSSRVSRNSGYWGPLYGYTGSLFASGRTLRCPYWYQRGAPLVFANTQFEVETVKTGALEPGYMKTLFNSDLIPTRTLLRIRSGDAQLQSTQFMSLFTAESWFLAYEVLVRGKHKEEFKQYLNLIRDGQNEEEAFSKSIKISYGDLDKELKKSLDEPGYVFTVKVPREPMDSGSAQRLTDSNAKARLAYLNLLWQHREEALGLATDALKQDQKNDVALAVIGRCNLDDEKYGEALSAVNKLDELAAVSAESRSAAGAILAALSSAVGSKEASVGVGPEVLDKRAIDEFERSISLQADYLAAWGGLALLYGSRHDTAAAQSLAARTRVVMEKHKDNGALAHAIATMSSENGMVADAIFFGEIWQANAPTQIERDRAMAFLEQQHAR